MKKEMDKIWYIINHKRKRGKEILHRKLNQVVTGSHYPIKIYILGSCDKDGFDMAAGVNLCDVRIEETLKIRIGGFKILREFSRELLSIICVIFQVRQKIFQREKSQDIRETVIVLSHLIKKKYLEPQR